MLDLEKEINQKLTLQLKEKELIIQTLMEKSNFDQVFNQLTKENILLRQLLLQSQDQQAKQTEILQKVCIEFNVANTSKLLEQISFRKFFNEEQIRLIECIKQMIITCAPVNYFPSNNPSLKQIWKYLKAILNECLMQKQQFEQFQVCQLFFQNKLVYLEQTLENLQFTEQLRDHTLYYKLSLTQP